MTDELPPLPRRKLNPLMARKLNPDGTPFGEWFEFAGADVRPSPAWGSEQPVGPRWMRDQPITIVFHAPDPDTLRLLFGIPAGWPLFYRRSWPMLPPGPRRLALPWGDSAYTSFVPTRCLPGDPPPEPGWCMGPPANGLTPSSEGPRRERAATDQVIRRMRDGTIARRLAAWAAFTPTTTPNPFQHGEKTP